MSLNIQVQGLDELRGRLGQSQSLFDGEIRRDEQEALKAVRDVARQGASAFSSVLPQSVQFNTETGGFSGAVGSVAKTILSIHEGRKPGHPPSFEQVQRWMGRKGIALGSARSIATHRAAGRPRKGSAADRANRDDAVRIVHLIDAHGTKGHPFLAEAAQHEKEHIGRIFNDGVRRVLSQIFK